MNYRPPPNKQLLYEEIWAHVYERSTDLSVTPSRKAGSMTSIQNTSTAFIERRIELLERQVLDLRQDIRNARLERLARTSRRLEVLYWSMLVVYVAVVLAIAMR